MKKAKTQATKPYSKRYSTTGEAIASLEKVAAGNERRWRKEREKKAAIEKGWADPNLVVGRCGE